MTVSIKLEGLLKILKSCIFISILLIKMEVLKEGEFKGIVEILRVEIYDFELENNHYYELIKVL